LDIEGGLEDEERIEARTSCTDLEGVVEVDEGENEERAPERRPNDGELRDIVDEWIITGSRFRPAELQLVEEYS